MRDVGRGVERVTAYNNMEKERQVLNKGRE